MECIKTVLGALRKSPAPMNILRMLSYAEFPERGTSNFQLWVPFFELIPEQLAALLGDGKAWVGMLEGDLEKGVLVEKLVEEQRRCLPGVAFLTSYFFT